MAAPQSGERHPQAGALNTAAFPRPQTAPPSPKPFKQVATGDSAGSKEPTTRLSLSHRWPALLLSRKTRVVSARMIRVSRLRRRSVEVLLLLWWLRLQVLPKWLRRLQRILLRPLRVQLTLLQRPALQTRLLPVLPMTMFVSCKEAVRCMPSVVVVRDERRRDRWGI